MSGIALVVAGDPERRGRWVELVERRGLRPVATGSPAKAQWLLEEERPCLALLDWTSERDRLGVSTAEVLAGLARTHRDAIALVCDPAVADPAAMGPMCAAHPRVLLHDPRLGEASLGARLDRLLGRTVGDLRLEAGVLCHSPSGDLFPHRLGSRLLLAHPGAVEIDPASGERMALLRLRRWLEEHRSCVHVTAQRGVSLYRMRVAQPAVEVMGRRVADRMEAA